MKKTDILGLGEAVIDWVAELPHFPSPDEKIDAITESVFSGGVTANYLVAISRLGVNCGFVGAIGDDDYGEFLINDFKREKVDITLLCKKAGNKTPVNFIFVAKGEKTIIQSPYMQTTKINFTDLNEEYIIAAKHLHTTMIHQDVTEKVVQIAKEHDLTISIDLESQIAQRGWQNLKNLLLKCDILIPNKQGAKMITHSNTPEEAARILIKKGIPIIIITMGKQGALITTNKYQKLIPTYHIEYVVDTTGAGDTFNGAFSVGYWIKEWDLEKSCRYANAAASLKIQKLGARTGMPTEKALNEFLHKNEDPFFI